MRDRVEQVQIGGVYLPKLPQRQDATLDQVDDLIAVANRLGMCDAADWVSVLLAAARAKQDIGRGSDDA